MTLKRLIFRTAVRGMELLFLTKGIKSLYHSNLSVERVKEDDAIDVITIAYNNAKVIELHNQYVKKYLTGNVSHIIVDNSSNMEESQKIKDICEREKLGYVRLHKNRMGIFSPSYSHATAANWIYRHIIKLRGAFGFGFIDHDIFPVCTMDFASILKEKPFYGAKRERNGLWYLSAIISFYRLDYLKDKKFDFMPITIDRTYLDTGGGNWQTIYKDIDIDEVNFITNYTVNFQEGDNRHQDYIELFDDERWVHTINGSYWKKVDVVKENIMVELIAKYEKRQLAE